jgi:hypothetical protein
MINLIFFLPTFSYGGAGNSIFRLCKSLDKKKYIINIISIGKCDYKSEFNNFGAKVFELKTKKVSKSIFELNSLVKKIISNKFSKNIFISGIHYANIASKIGKSFEVDENTGRIYDRDAMKFWSRTYEPGWDPKL